MTSRLFPLIGLLPLLIGVAETGKATRDWSGTPAPAVKMVPQEVVKEVVREVPVEKIVEKVVEKTIEIQPPPIIQWSEEFLSMEQPADIKPASPLVWYMETNPGCPNCPMEWHRVTSNKNLLSRGYTSGGLGNHFQEKIVPFDRTLPAWTLQHGDEIVATATAGTSVDMLLDLYSAKFRWYSDVATTSAAPIKAINAGTLKREYLELALKFIGREGTYRGANTPQTIPVSGINAVVPANLTASWNTDSSGIMKMTFSPKPSGRWGIVSIAVQGLSYNGQTITILTPFSAVNPTIQIVD